MTIFEEFVKSLVTVIIGVVLIFAAWQIAKPLSALMPSMPPWFILTISSALAVIGAGVLLTVVGIVISSVWHLLRKRKP